MKKSLFYLVIITTVVIVASPSCNTQVSDTEASVKIENSLQSVSYFQDTVGIDPAALLEAFTSINEAIDEIGYPDAGYKLWMIQSDTSDVKFMVEGFWPDQATYDLIHDHQLYIDAGTANQDQWEGLVSVQYYRFDKIKK